VRRTRQVCDVLAAIADAQAPTSVQGGGAER
jgi:hypothetical protein